MGATGQSSYKGAIGSSASSSSASHDNVGYIASGPGYVRDQTAASKGASGDSGSSGSVAVQPSVDLMLNALGMSSGQMSAYRGDISSSSALANTLQSMVNGLGDSFSEAMRESMQTAAGNSAQSQAFAREQMDFQRESDLYAMNWSAQEAQKTRDWQTEMSNSAHQREVDDLIAAGLNPVLSANNGASTPSGSTGQAYTSSGAMGDVDNTNPMNLYASMMSGLINSAVQLKSIETNAELQREAMANQLTINAANNDASIRSAGIYSGATIAAAEANAAASRYGYDVNDSRQREQYLSDLSYRKEYDANKLAQDFKIAMLPSGETGNAVKIGMTLVDQAKNLANKYFGNSGHSSSRSF